MGLTVFELRGDYGFYVPVGNHWGIGKGARQSRCVRGLKQAAIDRQISITCDDG